MRKHLDLLFVSSMTLLNIAWVLVPDQFALVGILWILPFIFLLPGYLLTRLFFYRRVLNGMHLLLLSIGLSLVVVIGTGFILNLLPIGLQRRSWTIALGGTMLVLCLVLMFVRRNQQIQELFRAKVRAPGRRGLLIGLMLILAMQIAALAVLIATTGAVQQRYPGFTQFWMLPGVQAGKGCSVRLGVRNVEATAITYRITMKINAISSTKAQSVTLNPNQEWNEMIPITPVASNTITVEAQLYREDQPGRIYRTAHIAIPNAPDSKNENIRPCGKALPSLGSSAIPVSGDQDTYEKQRYIL